MYRILFGSEVVILEVVNFNYWQ